MILKSIEAVIEENETGYRVLSPAVGDFNILVFNGTPLQSGLAIGKMRILNRLYDVVLPKGTFGTVVLDQKVDFAFGVGYKDELFQLDRTATIAGSEKPSNGPVKNGEAIGEGLVVRAFTTGIFYRRSSPDSPPFADVGTAVVKGKTLGLIEVMKSFNQIVFSGGDDFDHGVVSKIFAEDSQEVKSGDPLFLITHDGGN